jgi:predicted DNA-binding protein
MPGHVTHKKLAAFRLDPELIEGLQAVKDKTGAPIAEQVRRAIVAWLEQNGVTKTDRKRAGTRKRP